ncbi:MAG: glycosyltransferase family 2 protein [Steroidobacteraceae bacterium]
METSIPKVSVVMACYNSERYLAEAIGSIREQSFRDFELIIVNDGSTDRSLEIAQEHARQDGRIRVIHCEHNRGISAALNRGVNEARAEWVAQMDSDDFSYPDRLQKQMDYLATHPEIICVGVFPLMVDEKRYPIIVLDIYHEKHEDIERELLDGHGWALLAPTSLFRRDMALRIGGYREDMTTSMDTDFFLKLGELGKVANVPEVLFEYRVHAKSVTHARKAGQVEQHNMALRDAYARRNLQKAVPEETSAADNVTPADHHLRWGWQAFNSGYSRTAQRQGLLAVARQPWRLEGWKLLACVFRSRLQS